MIAVPNYRVLVPQLPEISVTVDRNNFSDARRANVHEVVGTFSSITLPFTPVAAHWVEVYVDGVAILNRKVSRIPAGYTHEAFDVEGRVVKFHAPVTGTVRVICDTIDVPRGARNVTAQVDLLQGVVNRAPFNNSLEAASMCDLWIVTQPINGYARLSDDRQAIMYVPRTGFIGTDTFSLCLMSHMGQESYVRCCYIDVT